MFNLFKKERVNSHPKKFKRFYSFSKGKSNLLKPFILIKAKTFKSQISKIGEGLVKLNLLELKNFKVEKK